jgi:ABC-type taurine transport system ATPase subunit
MTDGPFHLSSKMTWAGFIENVAKVAKITKENLVAVIAEMKWSFQKKVLLPLTDVTDYQTMLQQLRGLKDAESAIIIVALPASAKGQGKVHQAEGSCKELVDNRLDDGSMYGRKV